MFLTAGQSTDRETDVDQVLSFTKTANQAVQVPIFCLGFGKDVEFPFLRKLALQNGAVARKLPMLRFNLQISTVKSHTQPCLISILPTLPTCTK